MGPDTGAGVGITDLMVTGKLKAETCSHLAFSYQSCRRLKDDLVNEIKWDQF